MSKRNNKRRVLVVAGATGAIGKAVIGHPEVRGYGKVLALSRRSRTSKGPSLGGNVRHLEVDLSAASGLATLKSTFAEFSNQEIDWVHAAGKFFRYADFVSESADSAHELITANYITVVHAIKSWLPQAVRARGGNFVAYSSVAIDQNLPFMATFMSSKVAVESLVRSVTNEILLDGITLNCLRLPTVVTKADKQMKPLADVEHWMPPTVAAEATFALLGTEQHLRPRGAAIPIFSPSLSFFGQSAMQRFGKSEQDFSW